MGFQYPKTINKIHNVSIIHKRIKDRLSIPKTRLKITKIQSLQARATKIHKTTSQDHQNLQCKQDNQVQYCVFNHSYVKNQVFHSFSCDGQVLLKPNVQGPYKTQGIAIGYSYLRSRRNQTIACF